MKGSQIKIGAVLSYVNLFLTLAIGFFTIPLITNALGMSEYGVYSLTASLISYMSILDFGMHNVVIRYVAKYNAKKEEKEKENFLAISMIIFIFISIIIAIIGSAIYINIDNIFGNAMQIEEVILCKKIFIILLVNLMITIPGAMFSAIINAYEKFVFSQIANIIKAIFRLLLITVLLKLGGKSIALVMMDLIINVILIIVQMIYCFKKLNVKIKLWKFDFGFLKIIFIYTFFVFLASMADQINWKVDGVILGILSTTSVIAVSSVGTQLINYFRSLASAISGIFLPKATKMTALNCGEKELTDLMIKVGRLQFFVIGLTLIGFIILGKGFIKLWVGQDYEDVYIIFLMLAIALVIPSCQSVGINILEARNMHKFRSIVYMCIAVLNIIITVMLVPKYEAIGAAIGTTFSLIIGNNIIINFYYAKKIHLEIKRFFKEVFMKAIPNMIMVGFISWIIIKTIGLRLSWINLIINACIIIIIYAIIMYRFVLNDEEKNQIVQIKKKILKH